MSLCINQSRVCSRGEATLIMGAGCVIPVQLLRNLSAVIGSVLVRTRLIQHWTSLSSRNLHRDKDDNECEHEGFRTRTHLPKYRDEGSLEIEFKFLNLFEMCWKLLANWQFKLFFVTQRVWKCWHFPIPLDVGQLYFHQSYLDDDHWGCVIVLAGFLTINYN